MKTGIELIAEERQQQIEKHRRTVQDDVKFNDRGQLSMCAKALITKPDESCSGADMPLNWSDDICYKMSCKPYIERLIIAGALIAAEIDRLQNVQ